MSDTYARISQFDLRMGDVPSGWNSIMFVDAAHESDIVRIREIPQEYFSGVSYLILRCDDGGGEGLAAVAASIGCKASLYTLKHRVGKIARLQRVQGKDIEESEQNDILLRARATEMTAMLAWGDGFCFPDNFHFILPSGRHSAGFIRIGAAFSTVRDVSVIAKWLLEFSADAPTVIMDAPVLVPVALSLEVELLRRQHVAGSSHVLPCYPHTDFEIEQIFERAVAESGSRRLLVLLSVNGSGGLRDSMLRAIRSKRRSIEHASVIALVDTRAQGSAAEQGLVVRSFLAHGNASSRESAVYERECGLCKEPGRATAVPVDPRSFDLLFPTLVKLQTPAIQDPVRNSSLWEACSQTSALSFLAKPDPHTVPFRGSRQVLSIKVDLDRLLAADDLDIRAAEAFHNAFGDLERRCSNVASRDWCGFDTVLVPDADSVRSGFSEFWRGVKSAFGTDVECLSIPTHDAWGESLKEHVQKSEKILLLTLGTVSGTTLQHALTELQACRRGTDYRLFAAVVHARPSRRRAWSALCNSFAQRLVSAWLTFLPDGSPFHHEADVLTRVDVSNLSVPLSEYFTHRTNVCKGSLRWSDIGVLWSSDAGDLLTPNSIYGQRLSARETFAAVGAAIQSRREDYRGRPERLMFEMPVIVRSYYDRLIIGSMLRWLRPHEVWWGRDPGAVEEVINEVLERALQPRDKDILLSELSLAAVEGKLPPAGVRMLKSIGRRHDEHVGVELGREVLTQLSSQT